ncbi:MAG: serine/threonine protein kinase [Polyangiales bacterium]
MEPPQLGPRYRALYPLAAGGMAEVWVGAQKVAAAQRPVAIKRILPQFADDEKYVRMFLDEAHLASCIVSPNVVALIDADVADDGAPFLVMELVEGLSLSDMLKIPTHKMDVGMVCYVIQQAAAGLHDAHEARTPAGELLELVHRDVSPQNLLVGVDGRVRLADFGVARGLERMTQTQHGEFKGKLNYCAPEQLRGEIDRRADIFSLGVVMRQALSGKGLFGKSSSSAETVRKLLDEEIQPTRELLPDINPELAEALDKAIQRDPDQRYSSAAEFGDALGKFAEGSRTTLGKFVETLGGAALQLRRDKTAEHFADLRTKRDSQSEHESPQEQARSEIRLKAGAPDHTFVDGGSFIPDSQAGVTPRKKPSWVLPALVVTLSIGGGVVAGFTEMGSAEEEETSIEQLVPEAIGGLPQGEPMAEEDPIGAGQVVVHEPPADVVVETETEPPEVTTPTPRETPRGRRERRGAGETRNSNTTAMTSDTVAEMQTSQTNDDESMDSQNMDSPVDEDPSSTMNRANRLRRDLF